MSDEMADDELARLQEIGDLDLVSPEVDAELAEVTRQAAEHLGVEMGLVSIVLDRAQHFLAAHGLEGWLASARGTPIEWSFCALAVQSKSELVVPDAPHDARFAKNPLVTRDGVRCYAGVPLISPRGFAVGTLCVLGNHEHTFSAEDLATLRGFADRAMQRIALRASSKSRPRR